MKPQFIKIKKYSIQVLYSNIIDENSEKKKEHMINITKKKRNKKCNKILK